MASGEEQSFNVKLLINDVKVGEDDSKTSWYPLPFVTVNLKKHTTEFKGTFKHVKCTGYVMKEGNICELCKGIPTLPSFKKRLLLRTLNVNDGNRDLTKVRFDYMTKTEQLNLLQKKSEELKKCRSDAFFLKSKHIRLKLRTRTLREKLTEFSSRGDIKAIYHKLVKAEEKGILDNKNVFLETIESIANNFHVQGPHGKRYKSSTRKIFEALLIMGAAEDETAIVGTVMYHQDRDELLGFCGPKDNHKCMENNHIKVGNDRDAYDRLVNAFDKNIIGKYARVILLNPLHEKIPHLVALLMPTCNRFTHHTVYHQWQKVQNLYELHLEHELGPLIARKEVVENGYVIREIGDQDVIHNHKKIINHLDHTSRMLHIGPDLLVHMNQIELVMRSFPVLVHGLTRDHVRRDRDRQNWKVAQSYHFQRVQDCLNDLINGSDDRAPIPSVKGTKAFLYVVHQYVDIFFSPKASLAERISLAGFVTHFLGIWRNYVYLNQALTLTSNFLSRETYCDIFISVHFAVMLICFYRDNFPNSQCLLHLTGSDCCEDFFSKNGQFVGNHHVYPYGQMYRNVSHMIRLSQIEANDNAPKFAKAHIKQENVWKSQYPGGVTCSLRDYPALGEEISAWKIGIRRARDLAKELGIIPRDLNIDLGFDDDDGDDDDGDDDDGDDDDGDDDDDTDDNYGWFYKPFDNCNHDKLFKNLSGDTCNNNNHDSDEYCDDDDLDPCIATDETQEIHDSSDDNIFEPTSSEFMEMHECIDVAIDNFEEHSDQNSVNIDDSIPSSLQKRQRIDATLLVPEHGIQHKTTLVKLLNEDPNLSKDRLVRVRQAALPNMAKSAQLGTDNGINLFEDFAYVDRTAKTFQIGRIQRMQRTTIFVAPSRADPVEENKDFKPDSLLKLAPASLLNILADSINNDVCLMFRDFLNFMNANIEFYQNEEPVLKRPRREIVSCFDTPGLYEVSSQSEPSLSQESSWSLTSDGQKHLNSGIHVLNEPLQNLSSGNMSPIKYILQQPLECVQDSTKRAIAKD
ncbi:unnamed protein product [Mytilus edulis]|uniref:Uncharacterized protein n=1 Tax=Mytilus edulis TaxID=6550 RepID=A0A8S3V2Y7_MYTED|nr:unnamed protein product [Mytilus edulis]